MRPSVVRVIIAVSVLALCLSGVALGVSLSRSNSPVTTAVQVPNLLGRRQVVATGILGGLGLRYRVVTLLFGNPSIVAGTVVAEDPQSGSWVQRGHTITLNIYP